MAEPLRETYQLKVSLAGSKPPIWRRVLVDSATRLSDLHHVIQISMGWSNSHLHEFRFDGLSAGDTEVFEEEDCMCDETQYRVRDVLEHEKDSLEYTYDFGDDWIHKVTLEKVLPFDTDTPLPQCVKGKRACPPEDVGGLWGFYTFLEALNDPGHTEHGMYSEWYPGGFDPEAFDAGEVNEALAAWFGTRPAPSKPSRKKPKSRKAASKKEQAGGKRCGLCGKTKKLTKTECCGQWICDDEDNYVLFSYARNSCSRNHRRYTLCGYHFVEEHSGHWKDCTECRKDFETEMYVYYGTNEYNFEKLENPPKYQPTRCSACEEVIRLAEDAYGMKEGKYFCSGCMGHPL